MRSLLVFCVILGLLALSNAKKPNRVKPTKTSQPVEQTTSTEEKTPPGKDSPYGGVPCGDQGIAKYNLTFDVFWTEDRFPKQFPTFRPHAQWSKLVGRVHSDLYNLWHENEVASQGIKEMAELGSTEVLDKETQGHVGILDVFSAPAIDIGQGSVYVKVYADPYHSKVSFLSRLVPSPDWFVGVDSFELCEDGKWKDEMQVELDPYDAGTDRGFTFTAPNWPETPAKPISKITAQFPNHPANSFYYPKLEKLPTLAKMTLVKIALIEEDDLDDEELTANDGENELYEAPVYNNEEVEEPTLVHAPLPVGDRPVSGQRFSLFSHLMKSKTRPQSNDDVQNDGPEKKPRRKNRKQRKLRVRTNKRLEKENYDESEKEEEEEDDLKQIAEDVQEVRMFSYPKPCMVSAWQEWSACTKTCGYGTRVRMRMVVSEAEDGGRPCPTIKEQEMCGSMRSCSWSHFNRRNWNDSPRGRY